MKIKLREYSAPTNITEACKILKSDKRAAVLAGGTDILVNLRAGKINPSYIIDIKNIKSLSGIKKTARLIEIGSLTTMQDIVSSKLINGPLSE